MPGEPRSVAHHATPRLPALRIARNDGDLGVVAQLTAPKKMSADVRWLLVYVIMSRVRSLDTLVSFDFSDDLRAVIERGPPDNVVGSFDRLFGDKIKTTREVAREARRLLGWPLGHHR